MTTITQTTPRITNLYFYIPGRFTAQDIVCIKPESTTPPTSDHYFGLYSKKSLTDYQNEYPDMKLLTWDELTLEIHQAAIKPVTEITHERYTEMLEVMPPLRWVSSNENTTFMLCERFTGNMDLPLYIQTRFLSYGCDNFLRIYSRGERYPSALCG
ncbi:TPA: hypothetical protein MYP99_004651 [Citrobacter freundii]|nr:hypothetical protein [Citrobacter freundii]